MPRPKGTGKGATEVVGIRLEKEVAAFYRTKANEAGLSLSHFIKETLMAGLAADSFQRIEARLEQSVAKINNTVAAPSALSLPEDAWKSLFLTEAMLTVIVESRNPQDLYDAQSAANKRIQALKARQ